jgi:hypothetical protein
MSKEQRTDILRNISTLSVLCPGWRLCQMVANVGFVAGVDSPAKLAEVRDAEFASAVQRCIQGREKNLDGDPPTRSEDDTLPLQLPAILRGLEGLGVTDPERPFVALVLQVAEWAKEYNPFDFWDVEDADFLRAMQAHLAPASVAR